MRDLHALAASLVIVAAGLFPVVATQPACAASASSAALVIDIGGSVHDYCVELPGGSTSGIDLIKLASRQYGFSYNLGFGGKAVCALEGVGVTDSSDCFADMPDYWGYWVGNGSGGWNWSGTGADNVSISPGDVQGWTWGTGKDGSSHPQPPATDYEDVCKVKDSGGGGGGSHSGDGSGGSNTAGNSHDGNTGSGGGGSTQGSTGGGQQNPSAEENGGGAGQGGEAGPNSSTLAGTSKSPVAQTSPAEPSQGGEPSPIVIAGPISRRSSGGPPFGGVVVLLLAALLGIAGTYMTRGRNAKHRRSSRRA